VVPTRRYAKSGEVNIAYQAFGDGSVDLVFVPGFISHIELAWEEPYLARFLRRLAAFTRVIFFDKRGTGLSDPVARPPGLTERMDDIRAVMDAAGSQTAALFGGECVILKSQQGVARCTCCWSHCCTYCCMGRKVQQPSRGKPALTRGGAKGTRTPNPLLAK
jgi:hypothetical protein